MKIKNNLKLKPYYALDSDWTKIANSTFKYIDNVYAFKVYCYLCYRYNTTYTYAFPSLDTIAKECNISKGSVQKAIKYLEDKRLIVKYKKKGSNWMNNCYYVRYVEETREDIIKEQERIIETFEEMFGEDFETEIEIEIDEDGNIIEKKEKK